MRSVRNMQDEEEVTGPPDQFVGRDVLESYMVECNHKPTDPLDRYNTLIQRITDGIELLPDYDNPDETDEKQIKKNKEKQDDKNKLYNKACEVLKTAIVNRREIKYDHLIKEHQVYILTAEDADNCEALKDELEKVMNDFTIQQHEQHISELQEVHNQIYHILTRTGIYPLINPTYSEIKQEWKKQRIKKRLEKQEA